MTARSLLLLLAPVALASAQTSARDTVRLGSLHASAMERDPRGRQLTLLSAQSRLRQRNLDAEQRPSISIESQALYQSDVARFPLVLPGGATAPVPPHDTYDAKLVAQQRLYDPTRTPRRAVEDALLAESQARLRATLFAVRQSVNDLYFATLSTQSQMAELTTTITDLEAQGRVAGARVREGSALPSESLVIRAQLLRRRQAVTELDATRRATVDILADLVGRSLDTLSVWGMPDLEADVASARTALASLRARPEYELFARSRDVLHRQDDARAALDRPRVSAFARSGYGRPGLNLLSDKFEGYWLAGVQLQWTPWTWGTVDRDREVLSLQRQIVSAEEQQFTEALRRGVAMDLATIDRLAGVGASDDEIVALRERILVETRARFSEGVITSAEYVDRQTEALSARISRSLHRVELAQARAHFLTMLGVEVQ